MADHTMLQRTLRILQQLNLRRSVTVRELYDYFDEKESKRAIQRTLDAIQNANIPLVKTRGAHNEISYALHRSFDAVPTALTTDEMFAAMLLSQFRHLFHGTRVGESIDQVMEKMQQILPAESVVMPSAFSSASDILYVHEPGRQDFAGSDEVFRTMLHAIVERHIVRITYRRKTYDVHPYTVLLYMGAVYFIAFQPRHETFIYLALPRIRTAKMLETTFERDPGFSVQTFLANGFGLWSEPPVNVHIRFSAVVRDSILHRQWHHSQTISEHADGSISLHMCVSPSAELLAWILRWGHHAVVISPIELRRRLREEIGMMMGHYRRSSPLWYDESRPLQEG